MTTLRLLNSNIQINDLHTLQRQVDRLIDRYAQQIDMKSRYIDGRQIDWQIDRLVDRQISREIDQQIDRYKDQYIDRFIDEQMDKFIDE